MEIQRRSYRLLGWLSDAIERGFIQLDTAHEYGSRSDAAAAWIREHYHNLPNDARPPERAGQVLGQFAKFFSSYLETSFELQSEPGTRWVSRCGCYCDLCAYAQKAPHIKTKRLYKPDKRHAERLKESFLEELAARNSLLASPKSVGALLEDGDVSRNAALAAYGVELLKRCRGAHTDASVLALWRQFAWLPTGSPIKGFELTHGAILEAEQQLLGALERALPTG